MVVQEIAYAMTDQNETITIVAETCKSELEVNAYLIKRLLYTAESISANNQMRITVKDNDFEAIKQYFGK